MQTFEPVPSDAMPAPIRGRYFGVRLPKRTPLFDVRMEEETIWSEEPGRRNPNTGLRLWGCERAAFALGDPKAGSFGSYLNSNPSVQFYFDARKESMASETARIITGLRKTLAQQWREYRKAKRRPARPGDGGSCHYAPVAISLSNFGASVIVDERTCVVRAFRSL